MFTELCSTLLTELCAESKIAEELSGAYELRRILTMTYTRWGNNSVGQSSVLIKRRSRVQVPVALPILRRENV